MNESQRIKESQGSGAGGWSAAGRGLARASACAVLAVSLLAGPTAHGFGLFSVSGSGDACDHLGWLSYSEILGQPDNFWTWLPGATVTYAFDASFNAAFPDTRVHDQVRLAFTRWSQAAATANGTTFSYNRATGFQPFGDIRSIAMHEIGHLMGMAHPNQAAGASRNYRPVGASGAPYSQQPAVGSEVMRSWINDGDYNHIFSWDELEAYRYIYGSAPLNFVETASVGSADIVLTMYDPSNPGNWARACPNVTLDDAGDPTEGAEVISGMIQFNEASGSPLGFMSKGINWDFTCSVDVEQFTIRTRGTDNPALLFRYDNPGPNRFNSFSTLPVGVNFKDDLTHRWSNPTAAVPAGNVLHLGLELDVWDWDVVSAVGQDGVGTPSVAAIVGSHAWNNTIVVGGAGGGEEDGIGRRGTNLITARGFALRTSEAPNSRLFDLRLVDVTGLNLQLADLNRPMLDRLANQVIRVQEFQTRDLPARSEFVVVLEGTVNDLPEDLRKSGRYLILKRPDLLKGELMVFVKSKNADGEVGTYALLGREPIGRRNDPKLRIRMMANNGTEISWPYPSADWVLQSSPSLTSGHWSNVVANPQIIGDRQFIYPNVLDRARFYRLWRWLSPDLIPLPDAHGFFCKFDDQGRFLVTVHNRGLAASGATTTRVTFTTRGPAVSVVVPVPALAPGASAELAPIDIPAACFSPDCFFDIEVDPDNTVIESNETNNDVRDFCLG